MTVRCRRIARAFIPRTPVLVGPPQHVEVAALGGPHARPHVPRTPVPTCPLEHLEVPFRGGRFARVPPGASSVLAQPLQGRQTARPRRVVARTVRPRSIASRFGTRVLFPVAVFVLLGPRQNWQVAVPCRAFDDGSPGVGIGAVPFHGRLIVSMLQLVQCHFGTGYRRHGLVQRRLGHPIDSAAISKGSACSRHEEITPVQERQAVAQQAKGQIRENHCVFVWFHRGWRLQGRLDSSFGSKSEAESGQDARRGDGGSDADLRGWIMVAVAVDGSREGRVLEPA